MIFIKPNTDSSMIFKASEQQALGDENDTNTNKSQLDRHEEAEEEDKLNSKEKVVKSAFPDASIRKIRRLLIKHKGNPDKVIDAIYESEHKPAQNRTMESETINPNTDTDSEATAKSATVIETEKLDKKVENLADTQPMEDNSGTIEVAEETPDDKDIIVEEAEQVEVSKQEQEQEQQEQQEQPAAQQVNKKPKKLSAAERKKEQKRRQKENKLIKDRAKAARKAGYKQTKLQDEEEHDNSKSIVTQSMKEMYI